MGRKKKPTARPRIPLDIDQDIKVRARKHGHDDTVEYEILLRFALKNIDEFESIHLLGDIGPLLKDYARLKKQQRRK